MSAAPVLVAYASKHASTAEIAERTAAAMREAGYAAEARPASEVQDLSGYGAVVLGSAV
jgi:menaquinone-dependent protoporphyrinogen oxidase